MEDKREKKFLKAIAAMSLNRAIGKNGTLPWKLPEETQWVKQKTLNHILLMGRKTFESIGKPLPNRITIVLSSTMPPSKNIYVINNLEEIKYLELPKAKIIWSFGGELIYQLTLPYCTDLYLTKVNQVIENADTFFPEFEPMFKEAEVVKRCDQFSIIHYVNRNPKTLF